MYLYFIVMFVSVGRITIMMGDWKAFGYSRCTFMYSTNSESKSWFPPCTSSVVPSASTENSPFHLSNSNAAASSSLACRAFSSSSYITAKFSIY